MKDVIQFEKWNFLEAQFREEMPEWTIAKNEVVEKKDKWNRIKATELRGTKLYQMAKQFPAFNEDALPVNKMEGLIMKR